jgi:hypothetical protein
MLWAEYLAEPSLERVILARSKEPFLACAKIDVKLLLGLSETTSLQDHAVVYPWLFRPLHRMSTFVYIGTNSRDVALKMVLWSVVTWDFNEAAKHGSNTVQHKKSLARAYQLALIATSIAPDSDIIEYNPPMVTMRLKSIIAMLIEIGVYKHAMENKETNLLAIQRNIGTLIKDVFTGTGLPKTWTTLLVTIQEWHRHEIAVLQSIELSEQLSNPSLSPRQTAELYMEIESLLAGCRETKSKLYEDAHTQLHSVGWKRDASDYVPSKWTDITVGSVYSKLPIQKSWAERCEDLGHYRDAHQLFPELSHMNSSTAHSEIVESREEGGGGGGGGGRGGEGGGGDDEEPEYSVADAF